VAASPHFNSTLPFSPYEPTCAASPADSWINATTVKLFTTIVNRTQSSRAYGWDTNDYMDNTYRGCGNFTQTTFTHTGYTGTQVGPGCWYLRWCTYG
jgi:hypothetical protein